MNTTKKSNHIFKKFILFLLSLIIILFAFFKYTHNQEESAPVIFKKDTQRTKQKPLKPKYSMKKFKQMLLGNWSIDHFIKRNEMSKVDYTYTKEFTETHIITVIADETIKEEYSIFPIEIINTNYKGYEDYQYIIKTKNNDDIYLAKIDNNMLTLELIGYLAPFDDTAKKIKDSKLHDLNSEFTTKFKNSTSINEFDIVPVYLQEHQKIISEYNNTLHNIFSDNHVVYAQNTLYKIYKPYCNFVIKLTN